ncbi:Tigger transposable element-derived protein 6 [Cucumispora dikerogammari]|nr:Tigger transposable element-derived protein 6 [Cucumispora dikerogammari]
MTSYVNMIQEKLAIYQDCDVFNCDKTSLFYRLALAKSLVSKTKNDIKQAKDRITVLLCCNRKSSEKLKSLVIRKFKSPREFKSFNPSAFCTYRKHQNAWMCAVKFNSWLENLNQAFKNSKRKKLMFLDNLSGHKPNCTYSNIEMCFIPKKILQRNYNH